MPPGWARGWPRFWIGRYAAHAASGELVTHTAVGAPLMLWPGRKQRLWLLHGGAAMDIDHTVRASGCSTGRAGG